MNKELAVTTWNAWVQGDLKTAFANMSDEITWLVPGNLPNRSGVKKGKTARIEFARNAAKMIQSGFKSEIRRVYGEGDTVIIELSGRGKVFNGKDYKTEYCFVFESEAGKIRRVREYADTQKLIDLVS